MTGSPPIPVHLVLGSLGSGKTTAIQRLLECAPRDETWAVFVNEFGRVAIDPQLIETGSSAPARLIVKESRGGCLCCSGALELSEGLRDLADRYRPHRIIIEPTGLSDPESMKNQVHAAETSCNVSLASTIGIVDVRLLGHRRFHPMPFLQSLVGSSDFVIGSKADIADAETRERFHERISELAQTHQALILDPKSLPVGEWMRSERRTSEAFRQKFTVPHMGGSDSVTVEDHPQCMAKRVIERKSGYILDGWLFEMHVSFDRDKLAELLRRLIDGESGTIRLKGIFHTPGGWISIQSVNQEEPIVRSIDNARDSRLEIIMESTDAEFVPAPPSFDMAQFTNVPAAPCLPA